MVSTNVEYLVNHDFFLTKLSGIDPCIRNENSKLTLYPSGTDLFLGDVLDSKIIPKLRLAFFNGYNWKYQLLQKF